MGGKWVVEGWSALYPRRGRGETTEELPRFRSPAHKRSLARAGHGLTSPGSYARPLRLAFTRPWDVVPSRPIGSGSQIPDHVVIVLALLASHIVTEPIARHIPEGQEFAITGATRDGHVDPRVFVSGDRGPVTEVEGARQGQSRFTASVSCQSRQGRVQIEVEASGPSGPATLARFSVWCKEPPAPVICCIPIRLLIGRMGAIRVNRLLASAFRCAAACLRYRAD